MTVGAEWIAVAGDVDLAQERQLRERLRTVAERAGAGGLLVDVSGVTFMDCAGLRVLLGVRRQVAEAGGQVALVGPSPVVERLVTLAGLSDVLPVRDA